MKDRQTHGALKRRVDELEKYEGLIAAYSDSGYTFHEDVGHGWHDITEQTLANWNATVAYLRDWIAKNKDFYA